jgi:hypothetical protein
MTSQLPENLSDPLRKGELLRQKRSSRDRGNYGFKLSAQNVTQCVRGVYIGEEKN